MVHELSVWLMEFWGRHQDEVVVKAPRLVLLCLLFWLARRALDRVLRADLSRFARATDGDARSIERANRLRTLHGLVRSVGAYALLFVFAVMLLDTLGLPIGGILATASVSGVAVAFGAQKLVKDVISGFFLIVEDQFAVGEYVTIGAATGVVEEVGMRITRLRDDQGKLWILSNGDVTTVTNHSRAPVEANVDMGIALTASVEQATECLNRAGAELFETEPGTLRCAPSVHGVAAFDATHIVLRVSLCGDPRGLAREQLRIREYLLESLRKAEIPVA